MNSKPALDVTFLGSYDTRDQAWAALERRAKTMRRTRKEMVRTGRTVPEMSLRIREVQGVWWLELVKR